MKTAFVKKDKAISPRARRVARELGIDWQQIPGTGRTGRIRERDVCAAKPAANLHPTRRVIAERMKHSLENTSPVTLTTSVDATNLVKLHQQFKTAGGDAVPSYTDILVTFAGVALRRTGLPCDGKATSLCHPSGCTSASP